MGNPVLAAFQIQYSQGVRDEIVSVDAPELGEGVQVRFKTTLNVKELISLAKTMEGDGPHGFLMMRVLQDLALFKLCAIDEDGKPLIKDEQEIVATVDGSESPKETWFDTDVNGPLLRELVKRAKLAERVFKGMPTILPELLTEPKEGHDEKKT